MRTAESLYIFISLKECQRIHQAQNMDSGRFSSPWW